MASDVQSVFLASGTAPEADASKSLSTIFLSSSRHNSGVTGLVSIFIVFILLPDG
jgi:hypothetical protein